MLTKLAYPVILRLSNKSAADKQEFFEFKARKAAEKVFNFFWHLSVTVANYYLMRDAEWLPDYLGGTGDMKLGFVDMPFTPMNEPLYILGLVMLGHPLSTTIAHFFFMERNPDFAEMSLHHIAHLSLASTYLMTNMIPFGAVIAFMHDASDVFVPIAKMTHLMGHPNASLISFIIAQVIWFYMRLWCLPQLMVLICTDLEYTGDVAKFNPYLSFSRVFLFALITLHTYWFCLFLRMDYNAIFKGVFRDIQNDVNKMKQSGHEQQESSMEYQTA